ncbi:MAG TPA: hypothetical protein VIH59_24545 [Candidatus Tectomicrobia bacterium]
MLFPVKPLTLAQDRAAGTPSRATADPTEAALHVARLLKYRHQLPPRTPPRPSRRAWVATKAASRIA